MYFHMTNQVIASVKLEGWTLITLEFVGVGFEMASIASMVYQLAACWTCSLGGAHFARGK